MDLENNFIVQDEKEGGSREQGLLVYRKFFFQKRAIFEETINYVKFLIII